MSRISSETLFHFVREKNYLVNILKNDFMPRYVEEKFPFESEDLSIVGVPMLCFCDIRLSDVNEHVEWYGSYGIGMRRSWAIKNGLTPVQYYNLQAQNISELSFGLMKLRNTFEKKTTGKLTYTDIPSWYFKLYLNIWYMKPYEGKQFNKTKNKEMDKRFYDEKEWRYIPNISELKNLPEHLPMSLTNGMLSDLSKKQKLNQQLGENAKLFFKPKDIAYIIIASESERLEIIDEIRRAKHRYNQNEVAILSSKIISLEQIEQDF